MYQHILQLSYVCVQIWWHWSEFRDFIENTEHIMSPCWKVIMRKFTNFTEIYKHNNLTYSLNQICQNFQEKVGWYTSNQTPPRLPSRVDRANKHRLGDGRAGSRFPAHWGEPPLVHTDIDVSFWFIIQKDHDWWTEWRSHWWTSR